MRSLLLSFLLLGPLCAAPAPLPRRDAEQKTKHPSWAIGSWEIRVGSAEDARVSWYVTLAVDGSYLAKSEGDHNGCWLGRWRVEDGVIVVVERYCTPNESSRNELTCRYAREVFHYVDADKRFYLRRANTPSF